MGARCAVAGRSLLPCLSPAPQWRFSFSIAAVARLVGDSLGASLADIGILVGLYLAPGIALALPGATIGQRPGDRRQTCDLAGTATIALDFGAAALLLCPLLLGSFHRISRLPQPKVPIR